MSAKLFQTFAGVAKQHSMVNGSTLIADTPFLAMGLFLPTGAGEPKLIVMMQGGVMATVNLPDVRVELTDEMKKALAEVVLTS